MITNHGIAEEHIEGRAQQTRNQKEKLANNLHGRAHYLTRQIITSDPASQSRMPWALVSLFQERLSFFISQALEHLCFIHRGESGGDKNNGVRWVRPEPEVENLRSEIDSYKQHPADSLRKITKRGAGTRGPYLLFLGGQRRSGRCLLDGGSA
jgi:hypothetical protein